MKELVFLKHKQALTTSLIVADYFGKRHDHVIRDIEEQYGDLPEFGEMFRKATYSDSYGRPQKMYLMNRDGFFMLVTGFTGDKAKQFKLAFIKAFNQMEQILSQRQNAEWQEIRSETKRGYKDLSAAVHELYEWAVSHGCKASEKVFYMNFARLMNKTLGINSGGRDDLAAWQLYEVEKLQFIARTIIAGLIAGGADYHLPYKNCKSAFESYARLSYINERLSLNSGT